MSSTPQKIKNQTGCIERVRSFGFNDKGKPSQIAATVDCLRMITHYSHTYSEPLTMLEEFHRLIPDRYKPPKGRGMTLNEKMSYQMQKEIAAEKIRQKYGLEDEEEDSDLYNSYW